MEEDNKKTERKRIAFTKDKFEGNYFCKRAQNGAML